MGYLDPLSTRDLKLLFRFPSALEVAGINRANAARATRSDDWQTYSPVHLLCLVISQWKYNIFTYTVITINRLTC